MTSFLYAKKRSFFPILTQHSDRKKTKWDGPKGLPSLRAERLCDPCQVPWRAVARAGAVLWGTCNRAGFPGASCGGLVGLQPGRPVYRSRARFPGADARVRPIGVVCPDRGPVRTTPQIAGARGGLVGRSVRRIGHGRPGHRPPLVRIGGAGTHDRGWKRPTEGGMCATEGGSGQGLGWPTRSRQSATRTDSGRPVPTEYGWGRRGSGSARRAAALKGPRRPRPRGARPEIRPKASISS